MTQIVNQVYNSKWFSTRGCWLKFRTYRKFLSMFSIAMLLTNEFNQHLVFLRRGRLDWREIHSNQTLYKERNLINFLNCFYFIRFQYVFPISTSNVKLINDVNNGSNSVDSVSWENFLCFKIYEYAPCLFDFVLIPFPCFVVYTFS